MADWRLKPGDHVDRYVIKEPIAAGGMGEVYAGYHPFTNRPVALKIIAIDRQEKSDFKARMRAESMLLAELRHPNITQLFDAGITDDGMVWMAMELLEGYTLRELMHRQGRIPIVSAVHIICEAADGIGAAHELRVFHRDLKPENIFITKGNNDVKVLDFGAAKFFDRGVKTTEKWRTLGTAYYMAPEQLLAQGVDGRSDIYALGLIFYEMVVGHHPFLVDGVLPGKGEMGEMQIHATPVPLPQRVPGFPDEIWRVIQRSLQKARENRHATTADFTRELHSACKRYVEHAEATGARVEDPIIASQPGARRQHAELSPAAPLREQPVPSRRVVTPEPPAGSALAPTGIAAHGTAPATPPRQYTSTVELPRHAAPQAPALEGTSITGDGVQIGPRDPAGAKPAPILAWAAGISLGLITLSAGGALLWARVAGGPAAVARAASEQAPAAALPAGTPPEPAATAEPAEPIASASAAASAAPSPSGPAGPPATSAAPTGTTVAARPPASPRATAAAPPSPTSADPPLIFMPKTAKPGSSQKLPSSGL